MKTLLLGDICAEEKNTYLFKEKDLQLLFNDTLPVFEGNDCTFVNLECAITESNNAIKKFGPNLKAPKETAEILKSIGVTLCGLSNNHIFDFGKEGVVDTIKALDEVEIAYTGFGNDYNDSRKNYIMEKDGEKVAFIAVCEHEYSYALEDRMGSRPFDPFETMEDIRKAKAEADRVIVLYHGAKEYCRYPSPRLVKACREMVHNGADVILCQHTHCIGCYENYKDAHIVYGQGNFHFVAENTTDLWCHSLMVKYDTIANKIEFIPTVNTDVGIKLAKDEVKERILLSFAQRNEELANGAWKEGWHAFCESVRNTYIGTVKRAYNEDSTEKNNACFAHYLDCEAHTDVWRELCPTYNQTNEK